MLPVESLQTLAFALLALVVVGSAIWVVTLRDLFRAALSLGAVLVGVAGLFVLLEAEFLGLVQVLIYVGAVLVLVVFAIMLTGRLSGPAAAAPPRQPLAALAVSAALFALLASLLWTAPWPRGPLPPAVRTAALGEELITRLVLPFEVISLVLVAAIIGAAALAAPRPQPELRAAPGPEPGAAA
jgi:NAD(P)H-quinone oxidoreductase subunit 6